MLKIEYKFENACMVVIVGIVMLKMVVIDKLSKL